MRSEFGPAQLTNNYTVEFAERVFRQLQGFGEYGFPESHAASFAHLVYVSSWLKHHYPAAFAAALLNSQPMGFYAPAQLVGDARQHGVETRPVDVNSSEWDCTLESIDPDRFALRLGFRLVRGLSRRHADLLIQARQSDAFQSFADLKRRTGLRPAALQRLALADAFFSLGLARREALWKALPDPVSLPLFDACEDDEIPAALPPMSPLREVLSDYGTKGLTLRAHPMSFLRTALDARKVHTAESLATLNNGSWVKVAGLVLLRQRPSTAKGITFVTLEDETGIVNLIVRQKIWERDRRAARAAVVMLVHGRLQREGDIIHVLAARIEDVSGHLDGVDVRSRDFR